MIIIKFKGGLGNQMFQYALYKNYIYKNKEVKADLSFYNSNDDHNGFELDKIFNIELNIANLEEIQYMGDCKKRIIDKVRRRCGYRKKSHYVENEFIFDKNLLDKDNLYIEGYFQTEKYFKHIRNEILNSFSVSINDYRNEMLIEKMKNENCVALHVRRGDYIKNKKTRKIYGGITTLDYYEKAIKYINKNVKNPVYYVFSDDIKWVQENLCIDSSIIVDWNTGKESYKDMILMSKCKHNIIANSSFSWWGAWLNINSTKIVVAPNKWLNTKSTPDIYCKGWIKIDD